MRKILLTTGALAALMIAPALAQDTTAPQIEPLPAPETLPAPDLVPGVQDQALGQEIVKPKFIAQQETTELLASSLIGTTVYSPAGESLGEINDLVFNEDDGSIAAVVVGVGGFLGIGQKSVAVSFDAIMETTDADGNVSLVLDTSAEELEAAPSFVTIAQLEQQREAEEMQQLDPGLAPAPAPVQ